MKKSAKASSRNPSAFRKSPTRRAGRPKLGPSSVRCRTVPALPHGLRQSQKDMRGQSAWAI